MPKEEVMDRSLTVGELILELQQMPPDLPVIIPRVADGSAGAATIGGVIRPEHITQPGLPIDQLLCTTNVAASDLGIPRGIILVPGRTAARDRA